MREMKDSGIEWIGEIPADWEVSTIKREYVFQTGWTPDTTHEEYFVGENIWINISDMKSKVVYDSEKHISDEAVRLASMNISPKGSLLYAFKLSVGAVSFCGIDMYTNEAIATFLPGKNNLRFLYYTAPIFIIKNANENIYGAKLLNQKLIRNAKIVIPPLEVQKRIVDYLDRKCSRIDAVISRQQEVIEKLKAYKLSVITEAVTKGLNPDVPMKDSGIEWIGEIPADWNLKKLKHTFAISSGTTPKSDNLEYWDGDIPWVTPADYKTEDKYVYHGRKFLSEAGVNAANLQLLPVNSIIFSKRAPIGAVAITGAKLAINQGCISCVPAIECDIRYYYFILSIYTEQFNLLGSGTTFKEISSKDFGNFTVPVPSVSVQKKLADYLDRKRRRIDAVIERKQEALEKLKAYKKALIYEVVTGKKEV